MNFKTLRPEIEFTTEFDYSKVKRISTLSGCYVLSNFDNEILYIGKAINLQQRFKQHLEDAEKTCQTELGKVYWFSFKKCVDEYEISRLERGWLNNYELEEAGLPLLNKIHAG